MATTKINLGIIEIILPCSIKEYIQAFFARYDNEIMNEMINNKRFYGPRHSVSEVMRLTTLERKIFKGQLVLAGAYDIYLKNREQFKKDQEVAETLKMVRFP